MSAVLGAIKQTIMPQDVFANLQSSTSSASGYVKIQAGEKLSFRILSAPITGFSLFADGFPKRAKKLGDLPSTNERGEKPKQFFAFIVYQYAEDGQQGSVKIWDVGQKTILTQLQALFDGGKHHLGSFQLVVTRTGSGKENTKYTVTGLQSPMQENLKAFAQEANEYIKLDCLFTGENPFLKELPALEADTKPKEAKADDLPF